MSAHKTDSGREPVGIGLIGCGGIANSHLAGIELLREARLVAVCDIDAGKAGEFGKRAGVDRVYTDHRELLECDDVEMVDICTDDEAHARIAIDAANAGKHVLIEKPFAVTAQQGESVLAAVRDNGVKAMCAQSMRWTPKFKAAQGHIAAGKIGKPVYARLALPSSPFWREDEAERWRGRPASWLLVHNGMHSFDMLSWIFDSLPQRVYARSHPGQQWLPIHEYVTCNIRFSNGAIGQTEENRIMQPPGYPFHCEFYVVGTEGTLDLSDRLTHSVSTYGEGGFRPIGAHVTYYQDEPEQPFAQEISHMIACIRGDREPEIPLEFSLAILRSVLAGAESMRTGEPVEVRI